MNPREQIAEVLRAHERTGPPFVNGQRADHNLEECECDWIGQYGEFPVHVAAAVVEALGLTEEAAYRFTHTATGRSTIIEADSPTEAMARWINRGSHTLEPVRRWVSGWSVVGGEQSE